MRKISILYLHPIGAFGGASKSLLELLQALPIQITPHVICPKGQVSDIFHKNNIKIIECQGLTQFDNTLFSHYKGWRWLIILREVFYLYSTLKSLIRAKSQWGAFDQIHANELTTIPSAIIAKLFFRVPLVMHVRSLQRPMDIGVRGKLLRKLIERYVDQLVAIDCTVRASLPIDFPIQIVRNGFTSPALPLRTDVQNVGKLFTKDRPLRVGCVGGLLKLKGVYDFVEAARICNQIGLAVEFILVGENPRELHGIKGYLIKLFGFAADARADLNNMTREYNLNEQVKIVGFTHNVKTIYDSLDLLCFPSHLNACGRPVFEAAFSHVPSVVAVENPQEDTILHGQTGICIPARDPKAIADAVTFFYNNPEELIRMGKAAYLLATKNFDISLNASKMNDIYTHLQNRATTPKVKT
jgi:glycosyltransferase involved in cell wall biosynthesis